PFLLMFLAPLAQAFCGFYVSGADTSLYNDATMVVMMRSGTKTVLSMQNSYQGPPEAFAMVVPVPQVLKKTNVKTLPREIFSRVDTLASPRLVAYWEQDPCFVPPPMLMKSTRMAVDEAMAAEDDGKFGVKIEAQFSVGEYDIVVLSASDSNGLDKWLRKEKYNIPKGADEVLAPYVAAGTKFFVAKVDPARVTFDGDRAVLSPLRMHYDSEDFALPVRLGLLNAKGQQDLIVHILAPGQRYEVANYDNAFIPTNLRVAPEVQDGFPSFYEALFTEVARPRTVVTEYSWDASWCDPCPQPALDPAELATLGGDIIEGVGSFVLTRLHYRYEADGLDADLMFKAAPPVRGGQGTPNADGTFAMQGTEPAPTNTFQGRYAILHRWAGEVTCDNPTRGRWGGPPSGPPEIPTARSPLGQGGPAKATPALATLLRDPIPGVKPVAAPEEAPEAAPETPAPKSGGCTTLGSSLALGAFVLLPLAARRRRG
ncbi:MAG: DUF2330 domain-containing protein, partial [Myxococcota bacterium]